MSYPGDYPPPMWFLANMAHKGGQYHGYEIEEEFTLMKKMAAVTFTTIL